MTEPKFTPGPWRLDVSDFYDGDYRYYIVHNGGLILGEAWGHYSERDGLKNGRLMAAAPELYDALVGQVDNWKSQTCPMFINSGTEPEQCYYCVNKKCEAARQIKTIRDLLERINGEESE